MARLDDEQIELRLRGTAWRREGDAIVRERRFADFAAALRYVNDVGALAEEANHHPDLLLHGWNRVRLTLTTHADGGLTEADVALARRIDALD